MLTFYVQCSLCRHNNEVLRKTESSNQQNQSNLKTCNGVIPFIFCAVKYEHQAHVQLGKKESTTISALFFV